jgi:hypothetical protein
MHRYSIILPNERAKTYQYVFLFTLVINLLVFGFVYFNITDAQMRNLSLWGTVICLLTVSVVIINRFTKTRYPFRIDIIFLVLSIFWFLLQNYLLALCIICFAVIGTYSRKKFEIVFTKDGISYPSFPKKTFLWKDVTNVVLKDGMLTIDLKNNKLIQSVISKESADINEREFNLFCKELLQ